MTPQAPYEWGSALLGTRNWCGAKQPGSSKTCERVAGHGGEHQTTLTAGRTYNYWNGDSYPVGYRVGSVVDSAANPEHSGVT